MIFFASIAAVPTDLPKKNCVLKKNIEIFKVIVGSGW